MDSKKYKEVNREWWDARVDFHVRSEFYDVQGFLDGDSSLNPVELRLLGDITGKEVVHLQCHFGMDTISMSRLGARVVGLDFSSLAIDKAKALANETGTSAEFVCADVLQAPDVLGRKFDIVFTSYGVLGWLPDMKAWAEVVSSLLKPGGRLVLVEFHPVVWMFDDAFTKIHYSYFNSGKIVESGSHYTENSKSLDLESQTWNHSLSEVMGALISQGLSIVSFDEYDYSPYPCFDKIVELEDRKYQIAGMEDKLPMIYSIWAEKK